MQDMNSNAVRMATSLINGMQNKFPAKQQQLTGLEISRRAI
jgi:hypothetical protein